MEIDKAFEDYVIAYLNGTNGNAFEEGLEPHVAEMAKIADASVAVNDAYGNSLTASGTDDKVKSFTQYGFDNSTLNYPLWLALYNDSWVFRRAIDKPAQDIVNAGITLHGEGDLTELYQLYDRYIFDLIQINQWGALFGGSVGICMFDGLTDNDLAEPMNPKKVYHRKMRIYVTDRWYGVSESTELVESMKDIDFGKPQYYNITFADGHMCKVHHSYVLRYEHRNAPKLIKCGTLAGWGYAEGSHILNELSRDDQLKSAITSLVNKSLIEIIKMAGMRGVFMGADKGNEDQLRKRLEMVNWARSYNSLTFLDKDDEYEQRELTNLAGLSQLLETNMWLVAAALEMQGVLFGDLKGGLSQESDAMRRYAVTIQNRSNSYFRPVVQKLLAILALVVGYEGKLTFDFNSLVADELNTDKITSLTSFNQMLQSMIQQGIVSKYSAAVALKNYLTNNAVSIDISDDYLMKLQLEETAEIIAAYKNLGMSAPENILQSQFPQASNNVFEGKLGYLKEVAEQNPGNGSAPVEGSGEAQPTTSEEVTNASEKGE